MKTLKLSDIPVMYIEEQPLIRFKGIRPIISLNFFERIEKYVPLLLKIQSTAIIGIIIISYLLWASIYTSFAFYVILSLIKSIGRKI